MGLMFGVGLGVGLTLLLIGLLFGGDHDFDVGDVAPEFLNVKVLGTFLTVFGAGGLYASSSGYSDIGAAAAGGVAGTLAAVVVAGLLRLLAAQQASSHVEVDEFLGALATVTVRIGAQPGEISVITAGGQQHTFVAQAIDNLIIPTGRMVRIVQMSGEYVFVEPVIHHQQEDAAHA